MYFDGSVMKTGAGAGLLFISPLGEHMRYVIRLHFPTSNNMVEYEALLSGLRIAIELAVKRLDARGDSQLVIDQVMKESSYHDPKMEAYCNAVRCLEDKFNGLELNHVPRKYNEDADKLAKIASGRTTVPPNIFARDITKPSVEFTDPTETGPSSAGPSNENPPADEAEAMDIDFGTTSATRPKQWKSTRPPLRMIGASSISTG
jgi:ribonuclease HI